MQYVKAPLTPGWGRPGLPIVGPMGVAIHWTGNENIGANAMANRDWCESFRGYKVAAHLFVDDKTIVEAVPLNEIAYHCGSATSNTELAKTMFNSQQNKYLIGVEWCVNRDANMAQTYRNMIGITSYLFAVFGWDFSMLFRHYDMTGKLCPAFFSDNQYSMRYGLGPSALDAWVKFQRDIRVATSGIRAYREITGV